MTDRPIPALVAEFIGTFALCFVGILSIAFGFSSGGGLVGVALAHGLTIAVMVAALGHLSGAHFNPAVTFGFVVTGRMSPVRGAMYWAAQIAGALLGSLAVGMIFVADAVEAGTPRLAATGIETGGALALEVIATFFLVLVIFGSAVDERAPKSVYPMAIGLTISAMILAIGPATGAAMNPARSFGPAVVAAVWDDLWLYWVGPLIGGALAALLFHHVLAARAPSPAVAERGGPAPEEQRGHR